MMLLDTKDVDHFDMNDFKKFRHDLNFSLSDTNKQDGAENLIPRQMIPETNDKSKNKRGPVKPHPQSLQLNVAIDEDEYQKKKVDAKQPYQGKHSKKESPKDRYTHPTAVG